MTNSVPPEFRTLPAYPAYPPEDEIDLIDLWLVMARRKRVFLATFGLVLSLTIAIVLLLPPVFESRVVMQVGPDVAKLESGAVLVERLNEEYHVNDRNEAKRDYPLVENVSLNKGQQDILTITARARSAEQAQAFLGSVTDKVRKEHEQLLSQTLLEKATLLNMLRARGRALQDQIKDVEANLERLRKNSPSQAALAVQEKGKLAEDLAILENETVAVSGVIQRMRDNQTRLLRAPTLSLHAIQPRPVLYLSIGLVLGMLLAVIAVFVSEFISKARERVAQTNRPNLAGPAQ